MGMPNGGFFNVSMLRTLSASENSVGRFELPNIDDDGLSRLCPDPSDLSCVYSRGWTNRYDLPVDSTLTLMLLELPLIIVISKIIYHFLRPLKQPRIVCDVIGGMVFGKMGLGKLQEVKSYIFPGISIAPTRTLAAYGLMFHLFLMGVKMDPRMVRQTGRKGMWVGVCSVAAPFIAAAAIAILLRDYIIATIARGQYLIFLPAFASVTAFPVLGDTLAQLGILNTELGRLGMSAAMINSVVGWFFMLLFALINQRQNGWVYPLYLVLCLAAMVCFIVYGVGRWARWVVKQTPKGMRVRDNHIISILGSVLVLGMVSDVIGASPMNGPLIMGLVIPDGPPLGAALVHRVELLTNEVLMPLFFFAVGNIIDIPNDWAVYMMWLPTAAIVMVAFIAKLLGAAGSAFLCGISARNATLLGLMMNFRGVVEIIVLFHLRFGKLLDNEGFSVLLLLALSCTAIAAPLVRLLYDPLAANHMPGVRQTMQNLKPHSELVVMTCAHTDGPVPAMITLLEATSALVGEGRMSVYALHLVELQGRTSSTLLSHRNKMGFLNPVGMDRLLNAFVNYEQEKRGSVDILPFTVVAPFPSMYQDVCSLAAEKRAALIIIPYPRKDAASETAKEDNAIRGIARQILELARCSVGILVQKNLSCPLFRSSETFRYHVGVFFWGGPDDREALSYATRMAQHTGITLRVSRFKMVGEQGRDTREKLLDDRMVEDSRIAHARNGQVVFEDIIVKDGVGMVTAIRAMDNSCDLLVLGRRQGSDSLLIQDLEEWSESPELGTIGDMLVSPDFMTATCVLIMQQYGS